MEAEGGAKGSARPLGGRPSCVPRSVQKRGGGLERGSERSERPFSPLGVRQGGRGVMGGGSAGWTMSGRASARECPRVCAQEKTPYFRGLS